jgi:ubiquinone biosynthesis accessory factor UbiJ
MANPPPFLENLAERIAQAVQPPEWFVHEAQRQLVLVLNHVLQQEPEAQERLARHQGEVVEAHWRQFVLRLVTTPAGLFDLAQPQAPAALTLTVTETSPLALTRAALRGDRPQVRIAGDVQFAGEINWLVDHVRWDIEEDLARVFGDGPAHALGEGARAMSAALARFVAGRGGTPPGGAGGAR